MKVAVLMGGVSSERDISLLSGKQIVEILDKNKYEVIPIVINTKKEVIEKVKGIDFAFLAFHGEFGEDGSIQNILESLGIPYSGSGALTSALCMNKKQSKRILKSEGINVAKGMSIFKDRGICLDDLENLGYPLIVKPNNGGSSIGVSLVKDRESLQDAINKGFKFDDELVVEEYIRGEEYTIPVLKGEVLPILSIVSKEEFFNYKCKYDKNEAEENLAILSKEIEKKLIDVGEKCWRIFDCKAYVRVDIILNNGEPYVLELNTLPGMTKNSLFPKSAEAKGINYGELLDKIIQYSLM